MKSILVAAALVFGAAIVTIPMAFACDTSAGVLPVRCIKQCYFMQSTSGAFTIEQCRRFMWRPYDGPVIPGFRR